MNIKTTLVLLVLIALGGAAWLAVTLLTPGRAASETEVVLESKFEPANITRIEIARGEQRLILEKGPDGWSLPGKWPVRTAEAEQLVAALSNLRSRFAPLPVSGDDDLKKLGLTGAHVVDVTVKAGGQDYKLAFGEEPGQSNRFSRPTYLRLGESSEALRVAPGLIAVLDRPQEYYMQRRLFPVERIAKEGGERNEKVEQLAAQAVAVKGGSDSYTIVRAGDRWELRQPMRDRVDPDKIKGILTGMPDIWVEKFVEPGKKTLADFGLKEPAQTIKVTRPQGDAITLLIGDTSDKRARIVQKPGASPFAPKPQVDFIEEEYKFAKLQDNDQVFEIKADKLKDIVVAAATLRDPQLAHFKTADVKKLAINEGGRALSLVKEDGAWKLLLDGKPAFDAETNKVDDLLDKLAGLRAEAKDISDKADPKTHGLDKPVTVTVTVEDGKDKEKKTKEWKFLLGKQEGGEKGKLYVQVAGWDRINAVDGDLLKLAQRPALAYRNRRVLNFSSLDANRVEVAASGAPYALEHTSGSWRLALPVQADLDPGKADSLPRELSHLEAADFITSTPKAEDLDKVYGLAKPAATLKVAFSDKKKPEQVVEIGKKREGKEEYYARVAGEVTVFTIKKDAFETLTRDSLSLRPTELWNLPLADIAEVRVRRGEEYALVHTGDEWKLSGPFSATVPANRVKALADELAHPKAEKYVAHAATDLAMYGLDNPYLRVTIKPAASKDKDNEKDKDKGKDAKERVLLVGKPVDKDGKARYARLGDAEAIFVLGEKAVAVVDQGPLDLLDRNLVALGGADIKSIRTTTGKDTFTLSRDKSGWHVERSDGPPFPADADVADDAASLWSALSAQKLVAYGDKVDLAKFGLDKPATTVTVAASPKGDKAGKDTEHKLLLGDEVKETKGARYARLEGHPAVALLDALIVAELQRTPLDYAKRTLLTLDADKIEHLTRMLGTDTLELAKKGEHWQIVKPAERAADDAVLRNLIGDLARLRGTKVVAYPAKDVKPFGLDIPAAAVTLRVAGGMDKTSDVVVQVGKLVDEKSGQDRYGRLANADTVVILPGRLAEQLTAPELQFRDRLLAKVPAVGKLVLERGTRKATFVNQDGTWKMTQPLEAEAERPELDELIKHFAELRAARLEKPGDLKQYGLDRPQAEWKLFAADGGKEALTLVIGSKEKDGPRVYAKLANSDLVALLDERLSSQVLAEYRSRKVWPSLDTFQVERLTYGYDKGGFTLNKVGAEWQVVGKSDLKIKADAVRDTLDALARLKAERWVVDKDADFKLFGLEPPNLTLEVDTPAGKRTLKVGRQEGGSNRHYATVAGENSGAVFLLSEADARAIVRPLEAFVAEKAKATE
jgi:Domain of unknown function (DUF4340)